MALDVFIADIYQKGEIQGRFKVKYESLMMHGHCHQKSSFGTRAMHHILDQADGLQYHEPDTGCCGMAGSFGYEKEHYDISRKIADLSLIPEINKLTPDTAVVANGFSCRHQISHFTDRKALHWVECVEFERL
jgi:Fe-S oxidoreductase